MPLPLGKSSQKPKPCYARAQVLLGLLCLSFAAGVFAPWHAARAVSCGFGSAIGGGQCRGFITDTAQTTWTVPSDWNSASNTIELIGGGGAGGAGLSGGPGGTGSGAGGGAAYSVITNKSLSGTVGLAVGPAPQGTSYICSDNTANCSQLTGSNGSSVIAVACGGQNAITGINSGSPGGANSGRCVLLGASLGTASSGGHGFSSGGSGSAGGGGGGAAGPNGSGGGGTSVQQAGGTGDNGTTAADTNGTEWSTSPAYGSGGGGSGGSSAAGNNGGTYGAGGGGGQGNGNAGGAGQPGIIVITYTLLPNLLLQEDYLFENDSASSVNQNTAPVAAGTPRTNVEKGERFVVRFLLTNKGSADATTTIYKVQFDRNDGVWNSVTSGEISTQYGISGTSVSQITSQKTAATCSGGAAFNNDGRWYENVSTSTNYTTASSTCTELAWVFSTATAVQGTTYRLRLFNQTANNVLDGYTATPTLTITGTQDQADSKTGTAQGDLTAAPADSRNLVYFLDNAGYSAIAADDGVYDTATAFQTNSIPISLFKVLNVNGNNTDQATITWNGHSNAAPSSKNVFLDIWDNTHSAWITASTDNFTAANTDFTFLTATSGSLFYDTNFFVYVRVRQAAGQEALRTDLLTITFASAVAVSPGFEASNRSDTLSDSRPSATSNHTIVFTINGALDAGEDLEITWPAGFVFPAGLDCADVDVATGTQFTLNTPGNNCVADTDHWGVSFTAATRLLKIFPPTGAGTYVATGTQITIKIGLNATSQAQGNTAIQNASSGIYTLTLGGPVATGNILVSINAGVTVSATVAESLSLTVNSIASPNCTADDGAAITQINTTANTVPFGTVSANAFYQGCQDLVVSTNAGNGYSLTVQENNVMQTAGGFSIPDTTCDGGTCTEAAAAAWTNANNNGLGHTCTNQTNHDCASAYSSGANFRQFANIGAGETAQAIMSSSTPASATGRIKFRLSAGLAQAAGAYQTLITYIITGTY
jgi:hypothetical protein